MAKVTITYEYDSEEEARSHIESMTRGAAPAAPAAPVEQPAAPAAPEQRDITENPENRGADEVDADGMPYDEDVHSAPPAKTSDGLWRAKRGKADEAKAARAAFKASGGDVTPPAVEPEEEPEITPTPAAMPGMPATKAAPVSFDTLVAKASGMLERGTIDTDEINKLYAEVLPGGDASVLNTNESLRAELMSRFLKIEPA